jgi:hypothetical protein
MIRLVIIIILFAATPTLAQMQPYYDWQRQQAIEQQQRYQQEQLQLQREQLRIQREMAQQQRWQQYQQLYDCQRNPMQPFIDGYNAGRNIGR